MMKNKSIKTIKDYNILFLLLVLFVLVALSGCNGVISGRGGGDDDVLSINSRFHTGSKGITMRFLTNAPPPYIYDSLGANSGEIQVMVELHNQGAYSGIDGQGTPVKLYLGGFDQNIIHLPLEYPGTINLRGKSIYNAEGEQRMIDFSYDSASQLEDGAIILPQEADTYSPDIQLTACYYYETDATIGVCVAYDPYMLTTEQVCRPGTVSGASGSQGAPVAVSSVTAENVPGEIIFKIRISNVGGGRVVAPYTVLRSGTAYGGGGICPYSLEYIDLNLLDYEVKFNGVTVTSANQNTLPASGTAYCEPNQLKLNKNGQGIMYCNFPLSSNQGSAYQTPLQVNLKYGYQDAIRKKVQIRNLQR